MLRSNASKETAPHEMASFMTFQGCLHGLHDSLWPQFPNFVKKLLNVIHSAVLAAHNIFFHAVRNDILQSMTCDVRPHLCKLRCAVASCDVLAGPFLVVTCDVRACSAFPGLQSATAIFHIFFGNNEGNGE